MDGGWRLVDLQVTNPTDPRFNDIFEAARKVLAQVPEG